MEQISAAGQDAFTAQAPYDEMMPEIETCLKKIEENPAFRLGNSRTRSVEIALRVLKNQKECTINKTTYQHEWSWLICALSAFTGLPIYSVWHHYWTGYSKEKTLDLIKTTLTELLAQEDVIDSDLLSCVIKVNVFLHGVTGCFLRMHLKRFIIILSP